MQSTVICRAAVLASGATTYRTSLRRKDPSDRRCENDQHTRYVQDHRGELPSRLILTVPEKTREYGDESRTKRTGHHDQEEQIRDAKRRHVGAKRFRSPELARQHDFSRKSQEPADDEGAGDDPGRSDK